MLEDFFDIIQEPNKSRLEKLYFDNSEKILSAMGSGTKHQAWEGGYLDHINELGKISRILYDGMNARRELDFTLDEAYVVFALHDLEKPWKYGGNDEEKAMINSMNYQDFIDQKIEEYGIELNEIQKNALKYIHGEGGDYSKTERIMSPLAAFVHCCDTISARIWHGFPKNT